MKPICSLKRFQGLFLDLKEQAQHWKTIWAGEIMIHASHNSGIQMHSFICVRIFLLAVSEFMRLPQGSEEVFSGLFKKKKN